MSSNNNLANWTGASALDNRILVGHFVRLEPLDVSRHEEDLWHELGGEKADPHLFDYMFRDPFENRADFDAFLADKAALSDSKMYAVIDVSNGKAQALFALKSTSEEHGTMQLAYVLFGGSMHQTPKTTEAFFLLADKTFTLGYRRLEWPCHNENVGAKRSAVRFGFTFEGVLRQLFVIKGRNWDRAVYSILDREWPVLRKALTIWLASENFDSCGRQIKRLEFIRETIKEQENEKTE